MALYVALDTIEPLQFPIRRSLRSANKKRVTFALDEEPRSSSIPRSNANTCSILSSSYNSRRRPSHLDLMAVSVDLSNNATPQRRSDKTVRPLPPIPHSAPPAPTARYQPANSSPRRFRPLPSVPSCSSYSSSQSDTSVSISSPESSRCSTPATSAEDFDFHYLQSRAVRITLPIQLEPLSTANKSIKPSSPDWVDLKSPLSPVPPSPQTVKRRRIEKLRRHLGEPIPDDAVYSIPLRPVTTKAQVMEKVQGSEISTYKRAGMAAEKILELPLCERDADDLQESYGGCIESYDASCEGGDEVEDDLDTQEDIQEDYSWVLENGTAYRVGNRRYSSHWVYEQDGQRCEEPDYGRVIAALRAL